MGIKEIPLRVKDVFTVNEENNSFGDQIGAMLRNQKASDDKRANMAEEDDEVERTRGAQHVGHITKTLQKAVNPKAAVPKYAKGGMVRRGYGSARGA